MKIGIDISQTAYVGSGVANSVSRLIDNLVEIDKKNEYILFFSSLRNKFPASRLNVQSKSNVSIKQFKLPPVLLDLLWNKLHILPIESLIGDVDVFISSDWTEPPTKHAKKITVVHDLAVYKFPQETDEKIVRTQKRKLHWSVKECDAFICPSESTKKDLSSILEVSERKIHVVPWGV